MTETYVTLELCLKTECLRSFLDQLPDILAETRQQDGFIRIDVHQQHGAPERLILEERWRDPAAYQAYLQWRTDTGMFEALSAILAEEPRVGIWSDHFLSVTRE